MVVNRFVSILIVLRFNFRYISPKVIQKCALLRKTHEKSCLAQLPMGAKRWVMDLVELCPMELSDMSTTTSLNLLHLRLYEVLFSMDQLEAYITKVDCYNKSLECLCDKGEEMTLQGNKEACHC